MEKTEIQDKEYHGKIYVEQVSVPPVFDQKELVVGLSHIGDITKQKTSILMSRDEAYKLFEWLSDFFDGF